MVGEEGKITLEEARVVVHEEGMTGAVEKTEEERRVGTVEERAGIVKETSDSTAGTTAVLTQACRVDASAMVFPAREQLLEVSVGRV